MWRYVLPTIKVGIALVVVDIVALLLAFNVAHRIYLGQWAGLALPIMTVIAPLTVLVLYLSDAYRVELQNWGVRLLSRTVVGVAMAAGLVAAVAYISKAPDKDPLFWRTSLLGGFIGFALFASASRVVFSKWAQWRQRKQRWLVLGQGERAKFLEDDFRSAGIKGELVFVDSGIESDVRSDATDIFDQLARHSGDRCSGVIIATAANLSDSVIGDLMHLRLRGVRIYDLADYYESHFFKVPVFHLKDGWFALSHGFDLLHPNMQLKLKRVVDCFVAVILGILSFPLLLIVALLVKVSSRGPAFYNQKRTGLSGKEFCLHKFRTMDKDAEIEGPQWARPGDPRITRTGRLLRVTRVDELPQLWNVIRGEMSFVGPRPERPEFNRQLEKDIPYYELRYLVKPGITGWAQVMYPYGSSVEDARQKLQYDLYYIKNYSLLLDLLIAIKTVRVVLFGKGR